ncbi:metallophosphoesterase family protein [Massilia sp. W12]|uniref:metallophosphoesterase family protein n=1 Tax=Massilia sp. W12 TaxID=3126507 RepID=UPI0030CB492F
MRLTRLAAACACACLFSSFSQAATQYTRVLWDADPSQTITIGFSASAANPYVKFGTGTDESLWTRVNPARSATFNSSLVSHFSILRNLTPNTAYYFRACDDSGCGSPYWFKTMSNAPANMTFISGGDSRTNRGERQQANQMVAKIRPAFIDFGGDLTDNNTASQMMEWLSDWQMTYSKDTINGIAYQYIPGLVVNVGNHEDNDVQFVCKVFGADSDRNGVCSNRDTYNAFNINGNQIRLYNLNSQFDWAGADFSAQTTWLKNDLSSAGASAQWRIGGYHRPALPRTSSKPTVNSGLFSWAQPFYDLKMNIVFESDSHILKMSTPVKPAASGSNYEVASAGTVYLGEGAWGAPKRPADRSANWLVDLDSLSHFNVLQTSGENIIVRTVLFNNGSATALTREQRAADPLALPADLPLRSLPVLGTSYKLGRDANGRTTRVDGGGTPPGNDAILVQSTSGGGKRDFTTSTVSQSFKYGSSGTYTVSKVGFNLSRTTSQSANGSVSVYLSTSLSSSGEVAGSRLSLPASSVSGTMQSFTLSLPQAVTLKQGVTYYLRITPSNSTHTWYAETSSGDAYAGGKLYKNSTSESRDMRFAITGK